VVYPEYRFKQIPTDCWSTREKLALASSVMRSGDQNWWVQLQVLLNFKHIALTFWEMSFTLNVLCILRERNRLSCPPPLGGEITKVECIRYIWNAIQWFHVWEFGITSGSFYPLPMCLTSVLHMVDTIVDPRAICYRCFLQKEESGVRCYDRYRIFFHPRLDLTAVDCMSLLMLNNVVHNPQV